MSKQSIGIEYLVQQKPQAALALKQEGTRKRKVAVPVLSVFLAISEFGEFKKPPLVEPCCRTEQ